MLSEVSAEPAFVELYNPASMPRDLAGWTVDDGDPRTAPLAAGTGQIAAYGFVVLRDVVVAPRTLLRLLGPDGSVADFVVLPVLQPSRSFSRFPVHGGGWFAGTPPTIGVYNMPPAATATPRTTPAVPRATPAVTAVATPTVEAAPPDAPDTANRDAAPAWWWLAVPAVLGLGAAWLLRQRGFWRRIGL